MPGLVGVVHGSLQFMAYEELKKVVNRKYKKAPPHAPLDTVDYLGCAAVSKVFAATITYPYQVVRARMQDQYREWGGVTNIVRNTWRYEGVRGFYKGLVPYLLHVLPNICIVFLTYEVLVNKMNERDAVATRPSPPLRAIPLSSDAAASKEHLLNDIEADLWLNSPAMVDESTD